jgi:tight adherence protein C
VLAGLQVFSNANDPVRRRLARMGAGEREVGAQRWIGRFEGVGSWFTPRNRNILIRTRDRLFHAGYRSKYALPFYYGARGCLTLGLPLFALGFAPFFESNGMRTVAAPMVLLLAIGYIVPSFFLDHKIKKRQKAIRHALPDALDLLVVCTEAGLGLDSGLQRVSREMDISHPEMMDELNIVIAEMRAGVDRMEALRNLGKRTGLDDIQSLVMTLAQSMRFGTSISDSLRIYGDELRVKRMQRAREQAAKLTVKIVMPLAVCFLPGFLIVTTGAAVLALVKALAGM